MIRFIDVEKFYGSKQVLNSLNFSVSEKSMTGLIGNNGCGKTTTINIISNLISYDSGSARIFGKRINPKYVSYKKKMGLVLSESYLIESFTVYKYLNFVGKMHGMYNNDIDERINSFLKDFKITEERNSKIQTLSSGTKMKITLASALIHNPEVLVLDEPFISLDIGMQEFIKHLLKSFKGKKTLLITSHNLDLVADICDTFLIMDNGKIISRIEKKENTDIDTLKDEIKGLLSKNDQKMDLAWLK